MNKVALWSYVGVFTLIAAVAIGAFTRAYGAGLGCGPDWPTCNGEIIPSFDFYTALEYFHRVFAGLGFIVIAYASYLAFRVGGRVKAWAAATVLALLAQIMLGAVVVWYHLSPPLSALHTTMAIITVALATGMAVEASRIGEA